MSKKIITLVEDEEYVAKSLITNIEDALNDEVEVKWFKSGEEFFEFSQNPEFKTLVRASVFDLANNDLEKANPADSFNITKYINNNYKTLRVPIIIYSGFIGHLSDFDKNGTVFKIEKSGTGIQAVTELLELMHKTGFLEVFSANGLLEKQHPEDLHEVFTSQFRGDELKNILALLHTCHGDKCIERVSEVFQRMALRALVNKLTSKVLGQDGSVQVNVLEHFYRRTNTDVHPIWTGDILESKADKKRVYVIRPKCDLERVEPGDATELNILVCPLKKFDFPVATNGTQKQLEAVAKAAQHSLSLGVSSRAIPPSIFYPNGGEYPKGSAVDFANPMTIKYPTLANDYNYLVTLSDDFVNEIATRFGSYLVRPGIVEIDPREF